jgi:4-alpha-glucanotransferase
MTDPELARRAEQAGIAPVYQNASQQVVEVSDETLTAILAALDAAASRAAGQVTSQAPGRTAAGTAKAPETGPASAPGGPQPEPGPAPAAEAGRPGPDGPGPAPRFPEPGWGFTVQLYSVRSRSSWGHGDLRDLADLAAWSGEALGADFVLVNPLHAVEPAPPLSNSPYLPMSRRYVSPLYLRIEDVPEYAQLPAAQRARIEALAAPLRAVSATDGLIDRDAVWAAKAASLLIIHDAGRSPQRQAACAAYAEREGAELAGWSHWCALAERHGPDWREWPAELADPARAAAVVGADPGLAGRAEFHGWLQWLADEQLARAQQAATDAGMRLGVITDLAVGAHPGGADAWAHQDLLAGGVSVGAPPDPFNQLGQDWAQAPWHPQRLAAADYEPLAGLFEAVLRHSGGLRVDHVMGLMRLWWIPRGMGPGRGAYVRYDHRASVAALAAAAARAGAVAIGEDLGTVEPWIRDYLAGAGILGTDLLWFSYEPDGQTPLAPGHWRRGAMATVGSHDLPPVAGFLTGEQVSVRARLGLLAQPEDAERAAAGQTIARWHQALVAEGLLPGDQVPDGPVPGVAEFTVALYGYLGRTPAVLLGVSLADAVGDTRAQNIPGTFDEYPNWRVPLCGPDGRPVLLADLPDVPLLQAVAGTVRLSRPRRPAAGTAAPARCRPAPR